MQDDGSTVPPEQRLLARRHVQQLRSEHASGIQSSCMYTMVPDNKACSI